MATQIIQEIFQLILESTLVTSLVIMLMMLIEFINVKTSGVGLALVKQKHGLQIILAAALGLLPGCVGIFAVVSLYTHGLLTFGALLTACIATFGDEAFFMFSIMPKQALIMSAILFVIAIVAGFLVDMLKKKNPIAENPENLHFQIHDDCHTEVEHASTHEKRYVFYRILTIVLVVLFGCGICFDWFGEDDSIVEMFSLSHPVEPTNGLSGESIMFLVVVGLTLLLLLTSGRHFFQEHIVNHVIKKHLIKIFSWVFVILLLLAIVKQFVDLEAIVDKNYGDYLFLLIAILIGLIPESGPHLVVLFLFVDGIVPFTTLIANSILQEGHGGLPLLAERPKSFVGLKLIKLLIAVSVGVLGIIFK